MRERMRAAVVKEKDVIAIEDVPVPKLSDNSILIRVRSCAICGTDLRILRRGDKRARYPVIIGHEIAGTIKKVGKNVTGFAEGDRVCAAPGIGCGQCVYCKQGFYNICVKPPPPMGYWYDGGFAEYLVPPDNVVREGFVNKIPEGLSFDQASMSELMACCLNAQDNVAVCEGDTVLIMGAGPAGCMHMELSRLNGAKKIIVSELMSSRLELAKRFNPDRLVNPREEDLERAIMEETDGLGPNVILVCAPSKEAQQQAIGLLAPRGRANFFGGLPKDDCIITIDANTIHYKELFITGASSSKPKGNRKALEVIGAGKVDVEKFITHRFPLSYINKGFEAIESRKAIKVVINP